MRIRWTSDARDFDKEAMLEGRAIGHARSMTPTTPATKRCRVARGSRGADARRGLKLIVLK